MIPGIRERGSEMGVMPSGVRNLVCAALVIFVITVVIGIRDGTDILGLALLYGTYIYLTARESDVREVAPV